jgi:F0F1-type ATP synthase epsilon subunit
MGILKDHIPIISFLKPGIIKVISGSEEHNFYVEDGIVEFKDEIQEAEKELNKDDLNDQKRFLLNHKVEILKSISIN